MQKVFDLVGVGFGPSNMSLAAALSEDNDSQLSAIFLEKEPVFTWHKEMLIDNSEMQISFLKDISTLRNPSSPYTFLNFLHEQGRLASYINLKTFYPTRIEFHQYFSWVADKLSHYVRYNKQVVDIVPYGREPFTILNIITLDLSTGLIESTLARNVVVATGGDIKLPDFIDKKSNSSRVWHSSRYLEKIAPFKQDSQKNYHFCVVGRGQSAAEIASELYTTFPTAKISCVHRNFGYKPADESPFSNQIFDADAVNMFYSAHPELRNKILATYLDTNYAVVDVDLIERLYKFKYDESVLGTNRLQYFRFSNIKRLVATEEHVSIDIETMEDGSDARSTLHVDGVILATGYTYRNPPVVLRSLSDYFVYDNNQQPHINRHYRMDTCVSLLAGVYTQGCNEYTHGITDTLLSIGAIRANDILQHIKVTLNQADGLSDTLFESVALRLEQNQEVTYA
ncbi:MAG: SidA/IucD/PvdA family monooxygenase [Legionellaceae bacterium]|nr:SidA/IucD/PvdA family monooxygenase [Legionellaceae bacterium]